MLMMMTMMRDCQQVTHCTHRSKDFVISSGQRDDLVMWSVSMVTGQWEQHPSVTHE